MTIPTDVDRLNRRTTVGQDPDPSHEDHHRGSETAIGSGIGITTHEDRSHHPDLAETRGRRAILAVAPHLTVTLGTRQVIEVEGSGAHVAAAGVEDPSLDCPVVLRTPAVVVASLSMVEGLAGRVLALHHSKLRKDRGMLARKSTRRTASGRVKRVPEATALTARTSPSTR